MESKHGYDTLKIDTANRTFELNGLPLKTCKEIKIRVAPSKKIAEATLVVDCELEFLSNEVNTVTTEHRYPLAGKAGEEE